MLIEVSRDEYALDEKLADYVFFPLSHIFREARELPSRVLELALQCLRVLLKSAWKHKLSANLGIQLLILLGFIAGGSPVQAKSKETSEELTLVVFECLHSLFDSLGQSTEVKRSLTEATNVPALGHTVTVLLEGVTNGTSDRNQLAAVAALDALLSCLWDREAVASFFPGMVSALTKALQTNTRSRRSYRFLEAGIDLFSRLLRTVLSDSAVTELSKKSTETAKGDPKVFGPAWATATAAQVKLALANIIPLRNHDREEVRQALRRLCVSVLENCKESLSESRAMIVETVITPSATDGSRTDLPEQDALRRLAFTDPSIIGLIETSVHNWTLSLPRIMQTNDDSAKIRIAGQVSSSIKLLSDLELQTDRLDYDVAMSLRDSVLAMIPLQTGSQGLRSQGEASLQLISSNGEEPSKHFRPVLLSKRAEQETLLTLSSMVTQLSRSQSSVTIIRTVLDEAQASSGKALLANFWLALNFLQSSSAPQDDMDQFLELEASTPSPTRNILEELYSLSLLTLTRNNSEDDDPDWRLQALSLEAIALHSQHLKIDFRPELVDALYPILQLLGSPHPDLRSHAITCLNSVASSCGYASTSALVISNVDYLVNAVALKLNTFDISPQAPQVLLMMIKLCGASLIPYLDDLVGDVFAALDCFHGYPRLVEVLFAVLGAIVDEGAKSPDVLAITATNAKAKAEAKAIDHRKRPFRPRTVSDVARQLKQAREKKTANEHLDLDLDTDTDLPQRSTALSSEEPTTLAPTKTHQTLTSITLLTRHYLPHSSPALRTHLLHLVSTACLPLHTHEPTFLPLIASIWPLVVRRLHDPEPYVVIAAAGAVGRICACAGDFVRTRVEGEWAGWREVVGRVGARVEIESKGSGKGGGGGRGMYSANWQMWDAWVQMLVGVLEYVRVGDEMVDEALEMLGGCLGSRREVREVLEGLNPDLVWLEMRRRGLGNASVGDVPKVDGFVFKAIEL